MHVVAIFDIFWEYILWPDRHIFGEDVGLATGHMSALGIPRCCSGEEIVACTSDTVERLEFSVETLGAHQ